MTGQIEIKGVDGSVSMPLTVENLKDLTEAVNKKSLFVGKPIQAFFLHQSEAMGTKFETSYEVNLDEST